MNYTNGREKNDQKIGGTEERRVGGKEGKGKQNRNQRNWRKRQEGGTCLQASPTQKRRRRSQGQRGEGRLFLGVGNRGDVLSTLEQGGTCGTFRRGSYVAVESFPPRLTHPLVYRLFLLCLFSFFPIYKKIPFIYNWWPSFLKDKYWFKYVP